MLTEPRYVDISSPNGTTSNWSLPAGTKVGDPLIVWGLASSFTVTDPRLTWHLPHSYSTEQGGFWIGTADTLDPVQGSATAGTGARSANGRVLTFPGKIFTTRIKSVDGGTSLSYTVPVVPGGGSGALALSLAWAGIGGPGGCAFSGADPWTSALTNYIYDGVGHGWTTAAPLSGDTITVTWGPAATFNTSATILVMVGGAGYAPPCRNIKRGDVLDLGGARNYPPSKMTQTSSRGVGAY